MSEQKTKEYDELISQLNCYQTPHKKREIIGKRLADIGDQRNGVGLNINGFPDIAWKKISCHRNQQNHFYMSQNLITCSQFVAFLDHHLGFNNLNNWSSVPEKYKKQEVARYEYNISNYPRGAVSWYQAFAYSRWLDQFMPLSEYPDILMRRKDWQIRLPTEYEWQTAAKGCHEENIYPWGEQWDSNRCNTAESDLGHPVAVGLYPHGASDNGLLDMCGNIFEWCLNLFDDPQDINPRSEGRRSSRGGAYNYDEAPGRVGSRLFIRHSSLQKTPYGFRLCLSKRLFDLDISE